MEQNMNNAYMPNHGAPVQDNNQTNAQPIAQPTGIDVHMVSNQLGLNLNLVKQKVSLPIFGYMYAKMEKNQNDFGHLIEVFEYLFGQEETKRLFEYFKTYEELGTFLLSVMSLEQ